MLGARPAAPPEQILALRDQSPPRQTQLAQAEDSGDALPGGIALAFKTAQVGSGDRQRAVIEELADRLHRLPTSRRSLAAVWRRTCRPEGGRPANRR